MKKHQIFISVAVDKKNGIGKDGKLPWHFSKELKYFKKLTSKTKDSSKQNMVIMGRKTWESIPEKYRPLPNRKNVVLTRNKDYKAEGAEIANSLDNAFLLANDKIESIFIIGGAQIFKESFEHKALDGVFLTTIDKTFNCDTFLGTIPARFNKWKGRGEDEEKDVKFQYLLLYAS